MEVEQCCPEPTSCLPLSLVLSFPTPTHYLCAVVEWCVCEPAPSDEVFVEVVKCIEQN